MKFHRTRQLASRFGDQIDEFKTALRAAPEPNLRWDFLRGRRTLSAVWWALKNEHSSPREMALAVFIGVVIGCSPLYGFHVLLCLFVAFAFRLNKLVVWLGSNVSLPMFAPFLAYLSIQCAHLMLHGSLAEVSMSGLRDEGALDLIVYWFIGFIPVGAVLGLFFAALMLWRMPQQKSEET